MLEGTHEQPLHGDGGGCGRRVRLGFDHAVARRGAVAAGVRSSVRSKGIRILNFEARSGGRGRRVVMFTICQVLVWQINLVAEGQS